jgi:hypothetical protein
MLDFFLLTLVSLLIIQSINTNVTKEIPGINTNDKKEIPGIKTNDTKEIPGILTKDTKDSLVSLLRIKELNKV